jgi:hypothetical protein
MMRLLTAVLAVLLFLVPLSIAPVARVAGVVLVGLALAAMAMLWLRSWLATAAACAFLTGYASALWMAAAPVNVHVAAGFGLALLLFVQSGELARRARHAAVAPAVVRALIGRGLGLGGAGAVVAILAMAVARPLAWPMPLEAAPFLAAAGALGVVLVLAAILMRLARR